ncbi:MAG: hypothetical protein AAGF10_07475 [Verrucomicrobiota bacterium]
MSQGSIIQIGLDEISPALTELLAELENKTGLHKAVGRRGEMVFKEHFDARDQEPNKRGWAKQHFWAQISESTAFTGADDQGATVAIQDGRFAQKLYGGTIRPKKAKALAIPLREEAYGVQPGGGQITGLFIIRSRAKQRAFLARREGDRLSVYYALLKTVTQEPDDRALPPEREVSSALLEEIVDYLNRQQKGGK